MEELEINSIHYGLNLHYSYLLPLFNVYVEDDKLVIVKWFGACSGLKCIQKSLDTVKCFIPIGCGKRVYEDILGLSKKSLFTKLIDGFKSRYLTKFTLMYSPMDKLYVSSTIYLSRTTDYYVNTVKWVRGAIELNCFSNSSKCSGVTSSYQFIHFIRNLDRLKDALSRGYGDVVEETVELMKINGFGVKSAFAYLLHAHGLTNYAPIDRHYARLLKLIGLDGRIYSKSICIDSKLNCSYCVKREICLYGLAMNRFGVFNGFIQSLTYVYGRLTRGVEKLRGLEAKLLRGIDLVELIKEIKNFLMYIVEEKCR